MSQENRIEIYEPAPEALERLGGGALAQCGASEAREETDLRSYVRILRKHRWTLYSIVLVIFTVVLLATLKEKPVYRATGMLEIENENPNILTVQDLFQLENVSDSYLETQYKILQSESLARRVIAELHLDQREEFNPPPGVWLRWRAGRAAGSGGPVTDADAEQNVLRRFEDCLGINPVRRSRLVQVSFDSEDPQLAAQAVNAFTSNYIQANLENRWEATQKAAEWLDQQLQSMKIKLEKSEDDLQQYAQANGLLFLESEKGTAENIVDERLRQLQDELTKAQADRYEKEPLYRLVQAGAYDSLPGVVENKLMQDLTLRLSDLKSSYAQLATTFSPDYPRLKQIQHQIDDVENVLAVERKRVAERIQNDYIAAARRESLVEEAFQAQHRQANQTAARAVQYNILKREVDTNKQLYEGLLERLKEAGVSAGLKASNIRIVDPAVPPTKPVKPRVLLNLALALVVGLACATGVAFLQEHLDNTLKTSGDVEHFLQLPALAMIPAVESLNGHGRGMYGLPSLTKPGEKGQSKAAGETAPCYRIDEAGPQYSALSEAFRSLRTSVLLSTAGRPPRSLLITSAQPKEGKTTVSTNLAISLAQLGQRVLLIDGDLRRPDIHRAFQIPHSTGLVGYLTGQQDWGAAVLPTPISGLEVIPCGPVPPNPAELLCSERMQVLLREAVKQYSAVVVDSPPLLNVSDSRVLATQVEGVVLVVQGNFTPRELAQRAQAYVRNVGANMIGVVLNNIDVRRGDDSYYHYYHYEGYGDARAEGGKR